MQGVEWVRVMKIAMMIGNGNGNGEQWWQQQ
jgi:hypothetical protein